MEILSNLYLGRKSIVLICSFFCIVNEIQGLTCYQCSWSDSAMDYDEYLKDKKPKDLKYPIVEPFIGSQIDHAPANRKELDDSNCPKVLCKHESQVCGIWSFISDTPKNVTYMCVGNPNHKRGCFKQEIQGEDVKKYLKVEACLCDDKDLCNKALAIHYDSSPMLLMQAVLFIYVQVYRR